MGECRPSGCGWSSIRIEPACSAAGSSHQFVRKNALAFGGYKINRMMTPQKTDDQPLRAPGRKIQDSTMLNLEPAHSPEICAAGR